jgi:Cof subfamily protein (haloacid dehalogenase superfamily)
MPKIKLLAIDLDGTLLTSDKKISKDNIRAIQLAKQAGVRVVLASGRIGPSMLPFATELGLDRGPMICGNGTIANIASDSPLYRLHLHPEPLSAISDYAWQEGLHLNIYTPEELFFLRDTRWGDLYRSRVETVVPKILNRDRVPADCVKVLVVAEPTEVQFHRARILELVSEHAVRATESEPEYLEFMDASATKGYGLAQLALTLGIEPEETAAIGDYLNDLEMLAFAGTSGAVENAHPTAKNTANIVVSSNDNNGVSEFIHQIVLKQYE